jgi:hypothetical protein
MAPQQATFPLLHRFLGIGQVALFAVALGLKSMGVVPLLGEDEFVHTMAYTIVAISAVMAVVALVVLKPRAPERPLEQPVAEYWATPAVAQKVLPVWFLLEGAGIFSIVGYLISGTPVSLIAAGLAIMLFWLFGPMAFAKG